MLSSLVKSNGAVLVFGRRRKELRETLMPVRAMGAGAMNFIPLSNEKQDK
jgi:hypothetical protein